MKYLQRILVPLVFLGGLGLLHTCQASAEAQSAAAEVAPPANINTLFPSTKPDTDSMIPGVLHVSTPPPVQNDEGASRQQTAASPAESEAAEGTKPDKRSAHKSKTKSKATTVSYKIRRGDTLLGIARAHGVSAHVIIEANNMSNPRLIGAGKTLQIPGARRIPKNTSPQKKTVVAKPKPVAATAKAADPAEAKVPPAAVSAEQSLDDLSGLGLAPKKDSEAESDADEAVTSSAPLITRLTGRDPSLLNTSGMLLGLLFKFGLVLVLAYLGALALKRLAGARGGSLSREGPLKILETVTLGPNRWIHIISVGEQAFLIGSTPQQTSLLSEIRDNRILRDLSTQRGRAGGFAGHLSRMLGRDKENPLDTKFAGAKGLLSEKVADLRHLNTADLWQGGRR